MNNNLEAFNGVLVEMTCEQRARFVIARLTNCDWADKWLSGEDRSFESANNFGGGSRDALRCFASAAACFVALNNPDGALDCAKRTAEIVMRVAGVRGSGPEHLLTVLADWACEAKGL